MSVFVKKRTCLFLGGPHDELKKRFPVALAADLDKLRKENPKQKTLNVQKAALLVIMKIYPTCFSLLKILTGWKNSSLDLTRTPAAAGAHAVRTARHIPAVEIVLGEPRSALPSSFTLPPPLTSAAKKRRLRVGGVVNWWSIKHGRHLDAVHKELLELFEAKAKKEKVRAKAQKKEQAAKDKKEQKAKDKWKRRSK